MIRRLAFVILAAIVGSAQAQNFECGNKLISRGDSIAAVAAICGNPTRADHSSIIVSSSVAWVGGHLVQSNTAQTEVPVDVWLYNLGPDKLMRRIRFEDGKVVQIETLGYGYIEGG
ncbi:MAG: DUF2845 domain-containing protein [Steroidobacteraceae bacterium]